MDLLYGCIHIHSELHDTITLTYKCWIHTITSLVVHCLGDSFDLVNELIQIQVLNPSEIHYPNQHFLPDSY